MAQVQLEPQLQSVQVQFGLEHFPLVSSVAFADKNCVFMIMLFLLLLQFVVI